ncbi:hypothetical protein C8J57DRAFT_1214357 [Mycena rebaudengoi]|nr:hypothetical protein C8J57DRAFT_1214357 [Mycena rebaudengoi]
MSSLSHLFLWLLVLVLGLGFGFGFGPVGSIFLATNVLLMHTSSNILTTDSNAGQTQWAIASHGNTSPSGESLRRRKAIIWKVANTILPDSEQDGKLVKRPARQEGEVNTDDI